MTNKMVKKVILSLEETRDIVRTLLKQLRAGDWGGEKEIQCFETVLKDCDNALNTLNTLYPAFVRVTHSDRRKVVIECLSKSGEPITALDIRNRIGYTESMTQKILSELVNEGMVKRFRAGQKVLYILGI